MYMVYMYMSGTCNQNQHGRPIHAKAMCDSWDPTLSHCVMQTYTYAHMCVYIIHIYIYIHRERDRNIQHILSYTLYTYTYI